MDRLVDTHCHILPEVDDGARSMEETRQMLQEAYEDGIRYIIATPHHHPRRGRKSPKQLRRQLKLVREEAARISDELRIYLGTEIYFGQDIPERLREELILTINRTKYVLVEFSPGDPFDYICQGIQQIQMKGYEVILAHIERYFTLRRGALEDFQKYNILLQANADFFLHRFKRRRAFSLLRQGKIHVLGSDCHNMESRQPRLGMALAEIRRKLGSEAVMYLERTGLLLAGEDAPV